MYNLLHLDSFQNKRPKVEFIKLSNKLNNEEKLKR